VNHQIHKISHKEIFDSAACIGDDVVGGECQP